LQKPICTHLEKMGKVIVSRFLQFFFFFQISSRLTFYFLCFYFFATLFNQRISLTHSFSFFHDTIPLSLFRQKVTESYNYNVIQASDCVRENGRMKELIVFWAFFVPPLLTFAIFTVALHAFNMVVFLFSKYL